MSDETTVDTPQTHKAKALTQIQTRTLALAAIFQAAALTHDLATKGQNHPNALQTSLNSILSLEAQNIKDIYGNYSNLKIGLNALRQTLSQFKNTATPNIARYSFSLMHLERKLVKNKKMIEMIQTGVSRAQKQVEHFPITHENIIANFANIYTDSLSTFNFRIYITGEPVYLNNTATINKIRALLLSGIRAAVLWRQLGGKRWHRFE